MLRLLPIFFLLFQCARAPLQDINENMRALSSDLTLIDELEEKGLVDALKDNIAHLETRNSYLVFGKRVISGKDYAKALKIFVGILQSDISAEDKSKKIKEYFDIYETYGRDSWGEVLVTAYYTPVIKGSKWRTKKYTQPLYQKPKDLVKIDVSAYQQVYKDFKVSTEGKELSRVRGRVTEDAKIVPYWNRESIDLENKLKGKSLEIAWVDPVEAFFLQIQGSGKVEIPKRGSVYVHYADQNGHEFYPIGKALLDKIPLAEMSMQRIKEHLRSIPEKEAMDILSQDPSYVFFKAEKTRPVSALGVQVHDHRTIATDSRYYSNGTLSFIKFDNPEIKSRFVLDQDTGGGLKGRGRVDLYVGEGEQAGLLAGGFKENARLYYLVPKTSLLLAQKP